MRLSAVLAAMAVTLCGTPAITWPAALPQTAATDSGGSLSPEQEPQPQPPSRKWWENPRAAELGLSADQSKRIEEIFQETVPTLKTCNSQLERWEARLDELLSRSGVAEKELVQVIDQVEASRSRMSKERTLMLWRMRQELTPEQRERLKAMHAQDRRPPEPKK